MSASDDPGRVARDAYTYPHLPIVAGIIATAVGANLLIAEPGEPQHGVGLAMMLGGPALYMLGENLFQRRLTLTTNTKRLTVAGLLILLVPLAGLEPRCRPGRRRRRVGPAASASSWGRPTGRTPDRRR